MPGKLTLPKPFVKWAGGKDQLLPDIARHLPKQQFNRYFEPFLGGGAVFFYLCREKYSFEAHLSDLNEELITAYQTIKTSVEELIEELTKKKYQNDKTTFYRIRRMDRSLGWKEESPVVRTARMIYLNRTCYNGLYRVNSEGFFNVPFGRYKNPKILDEENLRKVSLALQNAILQCEDFKVAVQNAGSGDFVYLDPPYKPLSETANFTAYTTSGFNDKEQNRLAEVFRQLNARGCFVLESNSDAPYIKQIYDSPDIYITEVSAKRAISCDPKGRGSITELLIRNYLDTQSRITKQKKLKD